MYNENVNVHHLKTLKSALLKTSKHALLSERVNRVHVAHTPPPLNSENFNQQFLRLKQLTILICSTDNVKHRSLNAL